MPRMSQHEIDILRRRREAEQQGYSGRPLAASGLPDASATYGGGFETTINPYTGAAQQAVNPSSNDEGEGRLGHLPPLLGSREAEGAREVRVDPNSGRPSAVPGQAFRIMPGDGNAQTSRIARQMLQQGQFQDLAHKQRLEQIVATSDDTEFRKARLDAQGDAQERKHQQELSDFQWKRLVTAGSDPDNPMTVAEFDEAAAEIQRNSLAGTMPNPTQLRRRNEEAGDPALDATNTAKAWSQHFNLPEDQIGSFFGQPANGKFYTQSEKKSAFDMARQAADQDPSSGKVSAVTRSLSRLDKQIESFMESSPLFDDNGGMVPKPTMGSLFRSDAYDQSQIDLYKAELAKYNSLVEQQTQYESQLKRYASGTTSPAEDTTSHDDARLTVAPPAGIGSDLVPETGKLGFSYAKPFVVPEGTSEENQIKMIEEARQESARNGGKVVYVQAPGGQIYTVKAGQ